MTAAGITYYADPFHGHPGELRHRDGGRGFYFADPDGHNMEVFSVVAPNGYRSINSSVGE